MLNELQQQVAIRDNELYQVKYNTSKRSGVSKSLFMVVLLITFGLVGFTAYNTFYGPEKKFQTGTMVPVVDQKLKDTAASAIILSNKPIKKAKGKLKKAPGATSANTANKPQKKTGPGADSLSGNHLLRSASEYKIINTTYFYNTPDYNNRSDAYLTVGDATLKILDETNNFIHVIFINGKGKTTKGWLLKKDFTPANEY